MKTIVVIAFLGFAAVSTMAQAATQQNGQTVQMQCRQLAKGENNFLAPNETWVNGMACKQVHSPSTTTSVPLKTAVPGKAVAAVPERTEVAEATKPATDVAAGRGESEYMTSSEVQEASQGNPRWVTITAGSSLGQELVAGMADVNLVQEASIHLFTAQSWTAFSAQQLRRQYKQFTPSSLSKAETMRGLTVVGFGAAYGSYAGPQCQSISRIALISGKSGEVVAEAVDQYPVPSTWANAFGASATCQALVARFAEKDVQRVAAAAKNGEYFVGVFSGDNGRFLYKVKKKFLKQLGESTESARR